MLWQEDHGPESHAEFRESTFFQNSPEETARRAERETLSYEQYLLEVISRECEQRRKSKVQRLLKESALPLEKSLQNLDVKRLPAKAMRQLRTLLEGGFLDRKENVLVFGNPGSGKSHLLTALAQELVAVRERKMHFTKCALLMQDLLAAKRDLRLSREIKRLGRRHQEFLAFLDRIKHTVDPDLDVHLVLDNYGTHKHPGVKQWLSARPRYHVHFTPTSSSWLNQIERWFAEITRRRIRRGTFRSVRELIKSIRDYIQHYNQNPRPFVWITSASRIIRKVNKYKRTSEAGD